MAGTDGYSQRRDLYRQMEKARRSRVVAFVNGDRQGMETQIAGDSIDLLVKHLDAVFPAKKISLILHTRGGDTLAGWNIVNLFRMFCDDLEVIVPSKAHSAGTLISLGADRIVMTKQATLSPIDPNLNGPLNPQIPGAAPQARAPVSVEAVIGYIQMAKTEFGVKSPEDMTKVLIDLAQKVHPLVLGATFRTRTQIQFLAGQLLDHSVKDKGKRKKIIDFLCSESGSHDYTINRREALELGLVVEKCSADLYKLLNGFHESITSELELGVPFRINSLLGTGTSVNYSCTQCLIESTAASGHLFVTEGTVAKRPIVGPGGPQEVVSDQRTFEGWRQR